MKRLLQAYTSFNRTERLGIIALLVLLMLLLTVRMTMQYSVSPPDDSQKQKELVASWEAFKAKEMKPVPQQDENARLPEEKTQETKTYSRTQQEVISEQTENTLFTFDPNTIDSAGLRKLGLREKTTSIFLHWRAKGKKFYKKEELRKLYTLTEEEYLRLEPYILIEKGKLK